MKSLILILIISFSSLLSYSQRVAINADGSLPHPSAMLDVKSGTRGFLMPRTTTVGRLAIANPARGLMMYDSIANGVFYYDGANWQPVSIGKNQWAEINNEIFNVNTGNVGIGVNNPIRKLHIHDPTAAYIQLSDDLMGSTAGNGCFIGASQFDMILFNYESYGNIHMYTDGLLRATLDSTGRFGVGKLPEDKLDVKGDLRLEAINNSTGSHIRLIGGTTGTSNIYFYRNLTTPTLGGYVGYDPTSDNLYVSNGTTAYFSPAGLGITNTTPLTKLHILSGQDAGLGSTTNGYIMLGPGTGTNIIIDNNEIMARNNGAASPIVLQNDGGTVRIGNVAVPTGYLFAVNGKIITEELKVQLSGNWPDYVFKKDYKLKPYDQLRQFIAENNHLPNIPPAADLEKNGVEVGDMQKRMIEKIEELTLYILELENRVKQLEKNTR